MIADIALRKRDYDEEALFDPAGRYGSVDVTALATMVGASVARLGPGRQQLRHRRLVEQLAGLPPRAARPRHLRRRPGRALLGGSVGLRQPRRAARAGPRLRRDVRRPAREGPPPGVLSATRPGLGVESPGDSLHSARGNTQVRRRVGDDVKIEIWSDVVCPWCYIGKRRIENALAEFEHADEVEVHWRSYQLDPGAPTEPTESTDDDAGPQVRPVARRRPADAGPGRGGRRRGGPGLPALADAAPQHRRRPPADPPRPRAGWQRAPGPGQGGAPRGLLHRGPQRRRPRRAA